MYVCPRPYVWARVHEELLRVHDSSGGPPEDEPPRPLILGGWVFSSAREKHDRWRQTIAWACAHGCEHVIASVPPSAFKEWHGAEPAWSPEPDMSASDE
jgi:hypothetical protein